MLTSYREDYSSDALSDDLKKEALKDLIPSALEQTIKDVIMFRDLREDTMNSGQMRTIIMERIAGDVMNQMVRMDVDNVEGLLIPGAPGQLDEAAPDGLPPVYQEEWANSLGYSLMQGAIGKNGAGKGKGFGKDYKGGGCGKSYGSKDQKGKDEGQGAGKGERPVGACSHCWGFGHYYRACPVRLGP